MGGRGRGERRITNQVVESRGGGGGGRRRRRTRRGASLGLKRISFRVLRHSRARLLRFNEHSLFLLYANSTVCASLHIIATLLLSLLSNCSRNLWVNIIW